MSLHGASVRHSWLLWRPCRDWHYLVWLDLLWGRFLECIFELLWNCNQIISSFFIISNNDLRGQLCPLFYFLVEFNRAKRTLSLHGWMCPTGDDRTLNKSTQTDTLLREEKKKKILSKLETVCLLYQRSVKNGLASLWFISCFYRNTSNAFEEHLCFVDFSNWA